MKKRTPAPAGGNSAAAEPRGFERWRASVDPTSDKWDDPQAPEPAAQPDQKARAEFSRRLAALVLAELLPGGAS
ncbi:hypothetical protein [Sorangium sp. So ce204]|uniref:hypothetical protein n=1 Tax=Sorangium sp. So ce204 TaxID=3133288 RepID=UPI003F60BD8A